MPPRPAPSRCRRAASASAGCWRRSPTSNMSSGLGSSLPAAFCATSMIWRLVLHRGFERLDRLRAAHEQRDHHVREHHHAQRQQRQASWIFRGQHGMSGHREPFGGPSWGPSVNRQSPPAAAMPAAAHLDSGAWRLGLLAVDEQRLGRLRSMCSSTPPWPRRPGRQVEHGVDQECSMMIERRPRAPVLRASALRRAMAASAEGGSRARRRPCRTASGTA